jgi:hypothetical protein
MKLLQIAALQALFGTIKSDAATFANNVQEALITCAYFAFKDGNTTPFNQLLAAVGNGTHIAGITRWIELVAGIGRVNKGVIILNKKVRDESGVIDEVTFQPFYDEMSKVMWLNAAPKQKAESVFDEADYVKRVVAKLTKEGYPKLAAMIKDTELAYAINARKEQEELEARVKAEAATQTE